MAPSASTQATHDTNPVAPPATIDTSPASEAPVDPGHRHVMIAEAAFFIAQTRGFTPHHELDDWLAAEREVERQLSTPDH
jgi:hypothetical protein